MFWKEAPPPEEVLEMEPEELAPFVLRYLQKQPTGSINRYNFSQGFDQELRGKLGNAKVEEYAECLMEAWMYLERQGFVAPKPGQQGDWSFVTRRGRKVLEAQDFETYKQGALLPVDDLDPVLLQKVKPTFLRGDYDMAIFQAFKEVEVRVRKKANLSDSDIGVALMRKAFKPEGGVLVDMAMDSGEQVARMELFTGAVGTFKNPSSHRDVALESKEAADIVRIANQLLRIVDSIAA